MSDAAAIADTSRSGPPGKPAAVHAQAGMSPDVGSSDELASPQQDAPVLFLSGIERYYRQGDAVLEILKGAELAVWPGQSVALVAPSGAGKSTLLHVAGLLEYPDAGEVYIDRLATSTLSDGQRTRLRRTEVGFVYQFHHLLPEFSALENVILPQMIRGLSKSRGLPQLKLAWIVVEPGIREPVDALVDSTDEEGVPHCPLRHGHIRLRMSDRSFGILRSKQDKYNATETSRQKSYDTFSRYVNRGELEALAFRYQPHPGASLHLA